MKMDPDQDPAAFWETGQSWNRFFNLVQNGLVVSTFEGKLLRVNEALARTLGYTPEEMVALPHMAAVHPDDIPALQQALRQLAAGEPTVNFVGRTRTRNGDWRLWAWNAVGIGEKRLVYSSGQDITELHATMEALRRSEAEVRRLNAQLERKVAEQTAELRESNRRHRALLSNLEGMAYRCLNDRDWTMEFVSEGCQNLLGIMAETLVAGQVKYNDLIHPEDQERVWQEVQQKLARQEHFTLEYRVRRADGAWRWVWEQGRGIYDDQDVLLVIEGYISDITQRKYAEQSLKINETRYRAMFEKNPAPMLILDPHSGDIADANEAAGTYYGWNHRELTAKNIKDINTLSPAEIKCEIESAQSGNRKFFNFKHRRADGAVRDVEVASGPISLDGPVRILSIITDVTERKEAELKLRESEERLQQIACSVNEAVWLRDVAANRILFVNQAYETITGQTREQFYAHADAFINLVPPEDLELARSSREAALAGKTVEIEHRIIRTDGQTRWVRGQLFPVRDNLGQVYRLVAVLQDITDRVESENKRNTLEAQLRQAQKMEAIGQLAGGVAHDFNNLLAAIQMQVDLMLGEPDLSEVQRSHTHEILQATLRAANLTRQLLMFGRRQMIQIKPLLLNEIISNLMKMLQRILGEDIHVQVNYRCPALWIHADAGMMDQVLMNLVVNARDAMPGGGRLIINTDAVEITESTRPANPAARCGRFACLSVTDNGCGIAPENMQHIFEPFYTTKGVGKGTGLGLATVFGIIQQHQGWIEVESQAGIGATFRILLPLQPESAAEPPIVSPKPVQRGQQQTILLVEDEPQLRKVFSRTLLKHGYQVIEAENGVHAQEVWRRHQSEISLLITDLIMPGGVTGKQLGKILKEHNPQLKIIFITGYSQEIIGERVAVSEEENVLFKPFQSAKLAETVANVLGLAT